jgi:hypothetical protein
LAQAGRSPRRSKPAPTSASHARWLCRWSSDRQRCRGVRWRRLSGKAVVPRLSADAVLRAAGTTSAGSCASRRQAHHLDDPAAPRTAPARDAPVFSLIACYGLSSAQPSEAAVDVGNGYPRYGSGLRLGRPMTAEDWGQEKVERHNGPSSQKAEFRGRVPPEAIRHQGLKLEGKIGQPSRCGESPGLGEESRPFVPISNHQGWRTNPGQTRASAWCHCERRELREGPTGAAVATGERNSLGRASGGAGWGSAMRDRRAAGCGPPAGPARPLGGIRSRPRCRSPRPAPWARRSRPRRGWR